ncbi:endolytic transglycosylase MltG [Streptomyces nodosus]|uniref:Endolytic murein transglycosylase n=1 Tax=Streptomyces nodosus TaxID=40318 RepID=A0A0B5DRG5_9ACTN|nr:endolytic transglycosylase MltG [Streptomyces nodosus]AJE43895.1 aminodeoxychorismate lyase [Streptomyces nodosus]QEV42400.1 endolytic transglycosylase MltG [Streptomyces nodosus]
MQTNTPSGKQTPRGTRRRRATLVVIGAVVAATAVAVPLLMLQRNEENRYISLVIPEGWRAGQIYRAVDKALDLPPGSTMKSLVKAHLPLPAAAQGNPEGYLFPATYPIRRKASPESVLRYMVDTANKRFSLGSLTAGAQRNAMSGYQTVTMASIVQSEAATGEDMRKVARVILNRMERDMPLQMDATLNYAKDRFTLDTSVADTKIDSPYNTYRHMGLPPTPIASPGTEALRAVLNPTPGDWLYFVTVKPGDTRFSATYEEHLRNVAEFNRLRAGSSPSS